MGLDVTIITEEYSSKIREKTKELYGFDIGAVLIHATQTHSAPSCGVLLFDPDFPQDSVLRGKYVSDTEFRYYDVVVDSAVESVGMACKNLTSAKIAVKSGIRDKLAFNRRAVTRNGGISMLGWFSRQSHPLGPTDILYMEGPTDPEVGVFCVRAEDMTMPLMLLSFACHPVNVFNSARSYNAVSSDWPGDWCRRMRDKYGEECVPVVLNGCCGNINPIDPFEPDFFADHRKMGEALATTSDLVVQNMIFEECDTIGWREYKLSLDYREIPIARICKVDKILSEYSDPDQICGSDDITRDDWILAASTKSIEYCKKRMPEFMYDIQVFRIGKTAIVGLPGEPFVEGQLEIKMRSRAEFTYLAHCTSHYAGYLPTREAAARGGHESNPDCTYWAKLAPDSLDKVVEKTVELIYDLFKK